MLRALDLEAARARLAALGVVFGEDQGRRSGLTFTVGTEDDAARLLRDVVTGGVAVTSFSPAGGAIEEAYVELGVDGR